MNPACDVSPEELIAFTEEDLPERRMRELEAHVPSCPACQARLEASNDIGRLLSSTSPEPSEYARHDLMVRLYQEAEGQRRPPMRYDWAHVASVSAVCGTFLLAVIMLWSGLGTFIDAIQSPFQRASQDQSGEWVAEIDDEDEMFQQAPLPSTLGDDFSLADWWVRSGIRVIVYEEPGDARMSLEVSQFPVDDDDAPGYMTEAGNVNGVSVYVDDLGEIEEFRWVAGDMAHHAQFLALDDSPMDHLTWDDVERIVEAFLGQ